VNWWIVLGCAVAIIAVAYFAHRKGWIDLSDQHRGGGGGAASGLGIGDEVFHPTRHEAQAEMDRQTVLPAPAPVAGDGDKGVYRGRVQISLNDDGTAQR
jgi:hypothetical protein